MVKFSPVNEARRSVCIGDSLLAQSWCPSYLQLLVVVQSDIYPTRSDEYRIVRSQRRNRTRQGDTPCRVKLYSFVPARVPSDSTELIIDNPKIDYGFRFTTRVKPTKQVYRCSRLPKPLSGSKMSGVCAYDHTRRRGRMVFYLPLEVRAFRPPISPFTTWASFSVSVPKALDTATIEERDLPDEPKTQCYMFMPSCARPHATGPVNVVNVMYHTRLGTKPLEFNRRKQHSTTCHRFQHTVVHDVHHVEVCFPVAFYIRRERRLPHAPTT